MSFNRGPTYKTPIVRPSNLQQSTDTQVLRQERSHTLEPKEKMAKIQGRKDEVAVQGGNEAVGLKTLQAMEAKRIRNLEALKAKYQPRDEDFGSMLKGNQELDDDSEGDNYDDLIQEYYEKKKKETARGQQPRLLSSKYQRAESNYSQGMKFGKHQSQSKELLVSNLRYSYNPDNPPQLGKESLHQRLTIDQNPRLPKIVSNADLSQMRNLSAKNLSVDKAMGSASRSSSKYSVQQRLVSGYGQKFGQPGKSASDLYLRYVEQLRKASELREKGDEIKNKLKFRQGRIIESILVDHQLNKPKIRLDMNEDAYTRKKKEMEYLEFAKKKGKQVSRLEDWAAQVSTDMMKNTEESHYVFSNLKKVDDQAANIERAVSNMRRPPQHQPYFSSKKKEDHYMEAMRSKFGFLE